MLIAGESHCMLPAPLEGKICMFLFKNCQCQWCFFFNSPLKTMSWTSLSPFTKKRDCSVSGSLLELYC